MSYRVVEVAPLPPAQLLLTFSNGEHRVFDVSPYLDKGIFAELKEPAYFAQVRAVSGYVCWPREQDFSPDTLYLRSTPRM